MHIRTPSADFASAVGARPEHRASGNYGLLSLADPSGDQANEQRVARVDGPAETSETAEMETEEEDRQRGPPARSQ